jgi:Flp pilus assembly protein TadD
MTPAFNFSRILSVSLFLFFVCCSIYTLASPFDRNSRQESARTEAFQRGLSALKDNRLEDALAELTAAESDHPHDPLIHNFRGIVLVRLGKNAEAAAEYHEAIRLNPHFEDAYRNLGFLKWNERQLEAARAALERAVELSPEDSFAHYYLGRVQLDEQHYLPAIRELEIAHVPSPVDADFSIQLAAAYIALERTEEARKSLKHLATTGLSGAQSIHVAALFLALHENDAAIVVIQQLNQRLSSSEDSWQQFDLALVYLLAGKYETAIEQADRYNKSATDEDSKSHRSAEAWTIVGIASAHLNQSEQAVSALHQAAILAPGDEEYWLNLTRELMELSRYSDAIFSLQDGLAANPKSYALHLRLGAAQLAAGHYPEAESAFRDLVAAGDPLPTGYIGLAQVLLRTGRAEEADSELAAAEKKLGPSFLLSYFRGLALDRAGKPREALVAFEEAVKLNPSNPEAHLSLGKVELASGRVKDAIAELQEALRLSPDNDQAKRLLSKAYSRAGDSKRAASFAEATSNTPANLEDNLLGDFFVPHWQMPPEASKQ